MGTGPFFAAASPRVILPSECIQMGHDIFSQPGIRLPLRLFRCHSAAVQEPSNAPRSIRLFSPAHPQMPHQIP